MKNVANDDAANQSGLWLFLVAIGVWVAQAVAIAMFA